MYLCLPPNSSGKYTVITKGAGAFCPFSSPWMYQHYGVGIELQHLHIITKGNVYLEIGNVYLDMHG